MSGIGNAYEEEEVESQEEVLDALVSATGNHVTECLQPDILVS
jgi:hypothetical protein